MPKTIALIQILSFEWKVNNMCIGAKVPEKIVEVIPTKSQPIQMNSLQQNIGMELFIKGIMPIHFHSYSLGNYQAAFTNLINATLDIYYRCI